MYPCFKAIPLKIISLTVIFLRERSRVIQVGERSEEEQKIAENLIEGQSIGQGQIRINRRKPVWGRNPGTSSWCPWSGNCSTYPS